MFKEAQTFDPDRVPDDATLDFEAEQDFGMLDQGLSLGEIAKRRHEAAEIARTTQEQEALVTSYLEEQGARSIYELSLDDPVRIEAESLIGGNE
ncbi:MAG: hypothetical protein Q7R60_01585 [bacterium]|nr:hypothetical protein [bacterium]